MVQYTRSCSRMHFFVENFSGFEKNMEKNIRFCRQEKGEKSLIKIKKDDKMKYKVDCSKYRKI